MPSFGLTMPRMVMDRPGDDPTQNSVPGRIVYPRTFAVCPNRIFLASSLIGLFSLIAAPLA